MTTLLRETSHINFPYIRYRIDNFLESASCLSVSCCLSAPPALWLQKQPTITDKKEKQKHGKMIWVGQVLQRVSMQTSQKPDANIEEDALFL
jgi:hypothetical protein